LGPRQGVAFLHRRTKRAFVSGCGADAVAGIVVDVVHVLNQLRDDQGLPGAAGEGGGCHRPGEQRAPEDRSNGCQPMQAKASGCAHFHD
jgi:hypothetical protein